MSDAAGVQKDLVRYAALIEPTVRGAVAFSAETESARAVQVERAVIFPSLLGGAWSVEKAAPAERLIELASPMLAASLGDVAVVDRAGHDRPMYRGVLIYAWLQAFGLMYEKMPREQFGRWEEGLRPWCDLLENRVGQMDWPGGAMPASRGSAAAEAVWNALALSVAGRVLVRDAWTDLARDIFGKLTRGQQNGGAFLATSSSDNPETHWYHELVLLHAAASYAVQTEDRPVAAAVARNTEFHLQETQPDHATAQPWGVFAFAWNPRTRSLADQVLHSATAQSPGGIDGVSLVLLADALYGLRLFL